MDSRRFPVNGVQANGLHLDQHLVLRLQSRCLMFRRESVTGARLVKHEDGLGRREIWARRRLLEGRCCSIADAALPESLERRFCRRLYTSRRNRIGFEVGNADLAIEACVCAPGWRTHFSLANHPRVSAVSLAQEEQRDWQSCKQRTEEERVGLGKLNEDGEVAHYYLRKPRPSGLKTTSTSSADAGLKPLPAHMIACCF